MRRPAVPDRTLVTLRVLQTGCGLLVVASLVALGSPAPAPAIVAHDGAATVASAHPAVPTAWSNGGPLAIPTIGVVPPGTEDWFDPKAEPVFRAPHGPVPIASVVLPSTSAPTDTDQPSPAAGETPAASSTAPGSQTAQGTESQPSETPATDGRPATTTPATTTPATTTPAATTPATTTPAATTPAATTPATTTPPARTEPPHRTEEPPSTPAPPETNERGNIVLAVDDELTVFDGATGAAAFAIAVESIASDVVCTGPQSTPSVNGHLIAVLVRVRTGPDLSAVGGEPAVRAADFRFLGPNGVALTDAGTPSAESCLHDAESFPAGPLTAGQELTGAVVLDVPATTGTLVFAPDFLTIGAEWEYAPPAAG